MSGDQETPLRQLERAFAAVAELIDGIRDDQWDAPTPCTDWAVHDVVVHLVGMNRVMTALLTDQPPPQRPSDPRRAIPDSGAGLPHLGRRVDHGVRAARDRAADHRRPARVGLGGRPVPAGLADLLAHGWDLAQATGRPLALPDELAGQSLEFVRTQLVDAARPGRFAPAQPVADDAPAIDRLAAFLGRPVPARPTPPPVDR